MPPKTTTPATPERHDPAQPNLALPPIQSCQPYPLTVWQGFGICYIPEAGEWAGMEFCWVRAWGLPDLYQNAKRAQQTIDHMTYMKEMDGRVISMREAWKLVAEMCEVSSGRRAIKNRRTVVVDETKANYRKQIKHFGWFQDFVEDTPELWLALQTELFPVESP